MRESFTYGSVRGAARKERSLPRLKCLLIAVILLTVSIADAQQAKVYRVGVIQPAAPFSAVVEGMRDGLKELGYEDGKQVRLEIRDTKGDLSAVKEAAQTFERDKVNL